MGLAGGPDCNSPCKVMLSEAPLDALGVGIVNLPVDVLGATSADVAKAVDDSALKGADLL